MLFDWPVAAVLLGVIGTIMVAFMKMVPQRSIIENSKGEKCASSEDVNKVLQEVLRVSDYVHPHNHDIINAIDRAQGNMTSMIDRTTIPKLETISAQLTTLLERTRFIRGNVHDETD